MTPQRTNIHRQRSSLFRRFKWTTAIGMALLGGIAITVMVGAAPSSGANTGKTLQFSDARIIIEFNDTDEDVGIQMFVDGEPYQHLKVRDPNGKRLLYIKGKQSLRVQGLTELFFESSEPSLDEVPLDEFLARFPEGMYQFTGTTTEGDTIEGEALFTHAIPDGPELLTPAEGSFQDVDSVVVSWLDVADPKGSMIEAYQIIVTQEIEARPKRSFDVVVPATVTSIEVPADFLQPDADYVFEVLAIETSGNQTLSASYFSTLP